MRKTVFGLIGLLLLLAPAAGESAHLILLKNGGRLPTPAYWFDGSRIFFYYAGGVAGMERNEVARIEAYETGVPPGTAPGDPGKIAPSPSRAEKAEEPAATPEAKPAKPKLDLKEAKARKDRMTTELDDLAEKMREAGKAGNEAEKERLRMELRSKGSEIYQLTAEVTEQNKGKLPDGWWGR